MTVLPTEAPFPSPARALVCAALVCGSAAAATVAEPPVYRCGDSYSSQRCGESPPLAVADPRSAAERAQGQDVARRERRLAEALAAERAARDAPPAPRPARIRVPCAASAAGRCLPKPPRPRHAHASATGASGIWVAKVPAAPKASR